MEIVALPGVRFKTQFLKLNISLCSETGGTSSWMQYIHDNSIKNHEFIMNCLYLDIFMNGKIHEIRDF